MKPPINHPLLLNLQDSVSRMVYNLGFTSIDSTAHAKLVDLLADRLRSMGHTCRILAENAGRAPFSLTTTVDIKHLFRIHKVDMGQLGEYVRQVGPFPPKENEIHPKLPNSRKASTEKRKDRESSVEKNDVFVKHPTPPYTSKIPVFDDMDYEELGFCLPETVNPQPSPAIPLTPPPPPPPIPPLFSPEAVFDIPKFDPAVPPPPIHFIPTSNYTSPEIEGPLPRGAVKVMQSWPLKEESKEAAKLMRSMKNEYSKTCPSEKAPGAPKKTRKRQMQSNYEQRLREEHLAEEEKQKERKERRRMKAEMLEQRRSAERDEEKNKISERHPGLKFKFSTEVVKAFRKSIEHTENSSATPSFEIDENENKKVAMKAARRKTKSASGSVSSASASGSAEEIAGQRPLLKMRILFRRVPRGILVKKVTSINYLWKNKQWTPFDEKWKSSRGVLSQPEEPRKKRKRLQNSDPIPKLKLAKRTDGTYEIA